MQNFPLCTFLDVNMLVRCKRAKSWPGKKSQASSNLAKPQNQFQLPYPSTFFFIGKKCKCRFGLIYSLNLVFLMQEIGDVSMHFVEAYCGVYFFFSSLRITLWIIKLHVNVRKALFEDVNGWDRSCFSSKFISINCVSNLHWVILQFVKVHKGPSPYRVYNLLRDSFMKSSNSWCNATENKA